MLSDEQKKARLSGIGGSEIAAICGVNPYAGPIDVWRAKVEGHEIPVTGPMLRGTFLEDGVAKWWAHQTGAQLREVGTIRHPNEEIVLCTPDRLAKLPGESDELDLSIKVPGPYAMERWGDDGTDEAPEPYLLQAQWELIPLGVLYGVKRATIAAPVHGELRAYPVAADAELQGMLLEQAKRFWRDFVLPKRPPPPDASESYAEWLADKYPTHKAPMLHASTTAEKWARALHVARRNKEAAEAQEQEARNNLCALIGEAEGLEGDGWRITYKATKGRETVDWKAVCAAAAVPAPLIQQHTKRTPFRTFRPTFRGENKDE